MLSCRYFLYLRSILGAGFCCSYQVGAKIAAASIQDDRKIDKLNVCIFFSFLSL